MNNRNDYYTQTAYDSRRPRNKFSADSIAAELSFSDRWVRGQKLHHLQECREYLAISDIEWVKQLKLDCMEGEYKHSINQPMHTHIYFSSATNPRALFLALIGAAKFFAFFGFTGMLMLYYLDMDTKIIYIPDQSFLITGFIFVLAPLLFILLGNFLISKNLLPDINNIVLDRKSGTILAPDQKNKPTPLNFSELECYSSTQPNAVGSPDTYLYLGYPDRPEGVNMPAPVNSEWQRNLVWEFYQRFMDISKPLPDLPEYEPHRHKDPVTAEYDKRVGRPKDFWKNMDYEEALKLQERSAEAARSFPWGKTRKEAIASGWKPSGILPWEK